MPFQSAPDCAEAVIHALANTQPIVNRLNFKFASGYTQTDIDNLAAAVDAAMASHYLPICSSSVAYSHVHVRGLTNIIDLESDNATSAGSGSAGASSVAANVTLCVTLHTGFTGRSARGRFYGFPTVDGSLTSILAFTGAYVTALEDVVAAIFANASAANWTPVVLSRFSGGVKRTTAVATTITNATARNALIDSQRGRLAAGH